MLTFPFPPIHYHSKRFMLRRISMMIATLVNLPLCLHCGSKYFYRQLKLMAQPFLVALELGLHPDASQWRSYSEVVQCVMADVLRRLPADTNGSAKSTPTSSSGTPRAVPLEQVERWLHSLPKILQSKRGVCRIYLLAPSFIVELLEAFLKECGRTNHFGEASRRNFCFLIESITPLIYPSSSPSIAAAKETPFSSLVTTAQFTLDYVGGAQGPAIAASLIFSGVAPVTSLLPMLRRRLQEIVKAEEFWTADAAAMLCVVYLDGLGSAAPKASSSPSSSGDVSSIAPPDASVENPWTVLKHREPTPRISARQPSPRPLGEVVGASRDSSPQNSGEFVMLQRDPSFINIPFPEKMPTAITVPSAVVISVAILSSITLTVQPALKLGQWCLQALQTMPLTITSCALSHLLLKFPKAFRVSTTAVTSGSAATSTNGSGPLRFCEAVIIHCCRIVTTLFERRLQHGVYGVYRNAEECVFEIDEAIHSVDVMPCFLLLCIQAILCNLGLPLCDEAQRQLGRLFVHASRLYVSHHSNVEELNAGSEERGVDHEGVRRGRGEQSTDHSTSPSRRRGCTREPQKAVDVVSQVFRAALRAVDLVLHDYAAGNPETLRQTLAHAGPPNGVLINRAQDYGAVLNHQDLMETLTAAIDPTLDQRIKTHVAATLNTTAKHAQYQAAAKFSLVGWLPASSDLPVLGGFPFAADGGLCSKQKMWVVRRMLDYFRREWFLARVGLQVAQMTTTAPDEGDVKGGVQREGFFDCLPRAL